MDSPLSAFEPEHSQEVYALRQGIGLGELTREARAVATLLDGKRTLVQVSEKGRVSLTHVLVLVARLEELGLCEEVSREGWSELEEAFFAAEAEEIEPQPGRGERVRRALHGIAARVRSFTPIGAPTRARVGSASSPS
jgi:hypothetical protein